MELLFYIQVLPFLIILALLIATIIFASVRIKIRSLFSKNAKEIENR